MYLFPDKSPKQSFGPKINERMLLKLIIIPVCFLCSESTSFYPEAVIKCNGCQQFDASKPDQNKPNPLRHANGRKACESSVSQSRGDGIYLRNWRC